MHHLLSVAKASTSDRPGFRSHQFSRRSMIAATSATLLAGSLSAADKASSATVGPMVGHVSATSVNVWFRPDKVGDFVLRVVSDGDAESAALDRKVKATATVENDLCVVWKITGLQPATRYRYSISGDSGAIVSDAGCFFSTAPNPTKSSRVCLALGSCADIESLKLWKQIEEREAEALVLLGDTPYIDSTNLATARQRHREFLAVPELAALVAHTPTWGTWDDHDFGRNDSDGTLKGKENTRQAFVEYRANDEYGLDQSGIYTSFRYGPVEVFLLDTRWFARTGKSPVDADKPTLLGPRQWNWLKKSLQASTAPFKVIACGMIWDDKENTESDDWGTYVHERDALFAFIGEQEISGVVLIGGDIHCSRLLRYQTEATVGYPIYQFIVSPIHDRTIPKLNVPHPDLIKGEAIPHVWLRLEVDSTVEPATLHAEWVQMQGRKMWDITLTETQLMGE